MGGDTRRAAAAGRPRRRRDQRGETLPLLIIWPTLLVAIMLLALHAFIVGNAQAEASLAASVGLRAAWRAAAESDLGAVDLSPDEDADAAAGLPAEVLRMSTAASAAVAGSAADDAQAWRWWSNQTVEVQSDWCAGDAGGRPGRGEAGWVRVTVSGEVLGPLAALWPDRFDRVHAVAEGPARFLSTPGEELDARRPALPACP